MNQRFKRACWLYIQDSPSSVSYSEDGGSKLLQNVAIYLHTNPQGVVAQKANIFTFKEFNLLAPELFF